MTVSRQLKTVAALGLLSSAVWASTFASFSDTAVATSSFSAGDIDIVIGADPDDAYAFTTLSITNLKPGDTHYAVLPVLNDGSLAFTYDLDTAATGALATELDLGIAVIAGGTCDSTAYAAGTNVIASGTTLGASVTWDDRSLAAGASENLCFRVELPSATTNTAQGATADATFTFVADQLAGAEI